MGDAGFVEGLLARGVPVSLVSLPPLAGGVAPDGIVAHSHHPGSSSGGEFAGLKRCGKSIKDMPKAFESLMPVVRQVHTRWVSNTVPRRPWGQPNLGLMREYALHKTGALPPHVKLKRQMGPPIFFYNLNDSR